MNFFYDIWHSIRPYLIHMITDAIISMLLWVFLYLFKIITRFLPIEGWASELIKTIHSVGAVLAFSTFAVLFFIDVIKLHSSEREGAQNA